MTGCFCTGPPGDCPCIRRRAEITFEVVNSKFSLEEDERIELIKKELDNLKDLLNKPEVTNFTAGVELEAAHQRERWGASHDAGKEPADWFWLIGYLAQKAMMAQLQGDKEKALHHCVSTAAAMANWHLAISGTDSNMRPGIQPPQD